MTQTSVNGEDVSIKAIRFISIALLPAPKRDVLAYLGIPLKTGEKPEEKKEIVRKAEVDVSSISSVTCLAFVLIYLNRLRIVYRSPGRVCVLVLVFLPLAWQLILTVPLHHFYMIADIPITQFSP